MATRLGACRVLLSWSDLRGFPSRDQPKHSENENPSDLLSVQAPAMFNIHLEDDFWFADCSCISNFHHASRKLVLMCARILLVDQLPPFLLSF